MKLAKQPDSLPSNKVIAMAVATLAFHYTADQFIPPEVMTAWGTVLQVAIAVGAAWFTPDRVNVPK